MIGVHEAAAEAPVVVEACLVEELTARVPAQLLGVMAHLGRRDGCRTTQELRGGGLKLGTVHEM
jgi:hypothetical protein